MKNAGNIALREISELAEPGALVDGPIEVTLREQDFQVISVTDPASGREQAAPTVAKIHFTVQRFREMVIDGERSGIWEFTVTSMANGQPVPSRVWIDSADILFVKKQSEIL